MGDDGDTTVWEAYFGRCGRRSPADWLRGVIPDDLHERMPLIESESSVIATVRSDGHGVYDYAARALWRHLVAERVVRDRRSVN